MAAQLDTQQIASSVTVQPTPAMMTQAGDQMVKQGVVHRTPTVGQSPTQMAVPQTSQPTVHSMQAIAEEPPQTAWATQAAPSTSAKQVPNVAQGSAPQVPFLFPSKTTTTTIGSTTSVTTTFTTTMPVGPSPTLFCWSHMQPKTAEETLIRQQLVKRASIFACNGYAVIAPVKILLGNISRKGVYTWVNPARTVAMGKYGINGQKTDSFLNTETFLKAWDTLMNSGKLWVYDFVVKVDPDCVFFPDRLRKHVKDHKGAKVYFPNCGKWGSGPKLYGSLEVFSVQALQTYTAHIDDCKRLPWEGWGEDYYMQHCMDMIGVQQVADFNQVGDNRCIGAACSDWTKVAFHAFKQPADWFKCFDMAIGPQ